jgi:hypothetical protein
MRRRADFWACALAALIAFSGLPAAAQPQRPPQASQTGPGSPESEPSEAVFAPFPSHLRAATRGDSIILSWSDSTDVKGRYAIYRSLQPITSANFPSATKIGEVVSGKERFEDQPPDAAQYHYAILALADDGAPYKVFIPARNETLSPIGIERAASSQAKPGAAPAALPAAASAAPASPAVDAINAEARGDAIVIKYQPLSQGMRLVIYRGTSPIQDGEDLLDASLVAAYDDKDGSFADFPVPGIEYWYAVLSEDDLKAGHVDLKAGHNSTKVSVKISAAPSIGFIEPSPMRTPPLPSMLLERSAGTASIALPRGGDAPQAGALSPEGEKSLATILKLAPQINPVRPPVRLLKEEQVAPNGGEDYALSLIVGEKIMKEDWEGAADQLRKYLSLNRSPLAVSRARFYLGEALAELGSYREAFFELVSARADFSVETRPWIDYVLFMLRRS